MRGGDILYIENQSFFRSVAIEAMDSKFIYTKMTDVLWSPRFWFGETNLSWEDFEDVNNNSYDLLYPIPVSILILLTRGMFVKFVFENLGSFLGLNRSAKTKLFVNAELDAAFKDRNNYDKDNIIEKAIESGMTERQAERWLRKQIQNDAF